MLSGIETTLAVQADRARGLEHLRWRLDDDILVFLDLETGQYHAIGADGAQRFIAYTKGAQDEELEALLTEAGLIRLQRNKTRCVTPTVVWGALPMAVKTLLVARWYLTKRKFHRSLDWAMAHSPSRALPNAIETFRRAESVFPSRLGDFDCLPRAIGMFAFLRHASLRPEFIVGFRRHPFTAHAWVEVEGNPVLESQSDQDYIASFSEILRVC